MRNIRDPLSISLSSFFYSHCDSGLSQCTTRVNPWCNYHRIEEKLLTPVRCPQWLVTINGSPNRGSESRAAAACLSASGSDSLSLTDVIAVYSSELAQV